MARDTEPRPEFAESLREWFVDELRAPRADDADLRSQPPSTVPLVPERGVDRRPDRGRRRWLLLANVAALLGVIAGLAWLGTRAGDPAADEPAPVPTPAAVDPQVVLTDVCREFRVGASGLPLGASSGEVVRAAIDVRDRLSAAAERLDALESGELGEARRLVDEATAAATVLRDVAASDRGSIDTAVRNLDLLVVAWERELTDVVGDGCEALPTLRDVF